MAKEREFASVSWTIRDVQELASQLTDEQAEEFLFNNQHTLRDALISHGWAVLEELLIVEGITIRQWDEEEPSECPYCHQNRITDEDVYVCPQCGKETCTDCAGRCGCDEEGDYRNDGELVSAIEDARSAIEQATLTGGQKGSDDDA